jgi:molybdenum storage protein
LSDAPKETDGRHHVESMLIECFGCKTFTLVKDVDGPYDRDPRGHAGAGLIREIDTDELRRRNFESLPFERILISLLENARLLRSIQIVNGRHPERIKAALEGERVGTIIHAGNKARG